MLFLIYIAYKLNMLLVKYQKLSDKADKINYTNYLGTVKQ
jgi:hypothetical protein